MFSQLRNIESAFKLVRGFCVVFMCCCLLLSGWVCWKSFEAVRLAEGKVYVLAGGAAIEALASSRGDNLAVEARDHVRRFHEAFFSLDPDNEVISRHIASALNLADVTAKRAYDNLREQGFYAGLIAGNISVRISVDSIALDTLAVPLSFTCFARETLVRSSSTVQRRLVTSGYLRQVSRSDQNPHGFLIERWQVLENRDLPAGR
ncbi:conjugative transposon protein TraK [Pedobacter sp. HMF7647]|uniref:Conjugative transposon protein TraK n=1 Tax=Hufsiella arboris TaxID=2695275 RepID=A0A7K1Y7M0_9SPHI|nr:conjugative transposon protein TraK [Hufsiella arboris]MXV50430.1 conjugative transposon protein TraK [Hufsiella arboris]